MQTEVILRNQYFRSDSQGKISIILTNYVSFPEILEGMEEILKADIIHDLEHQRQKRQDDIRVQSSGRSDPTSRQAIQNVMLEKAIQRRDIEHEIAGTEDPELYRKDLQRIEHMRQDYIVVNAFMKMLPHQELYLIREYYQCRKQQGDMEKLADKYRIQPHSLYVRVSRIKVRITELALPRFEQKYGR